MIAIGERVPELTLLSADGAPCPLSQYAGRKLLLVFVRHLGCVACHAHLSDLDRNYQAIRAAGAEVLAVAMRKPEFLREFQKNGKYTIPMACDPERAAYRLFGLERTTWTSYLRPGVIGGYMGLMVRGWMPGIPAKGEDVHQLGGDFIVDRDGKLIYAFRSSDPSQSAPIAELLKLLTT
jgi:peroxiredoxin